MMIGRSNVDRWIKANEDIIINQSRSFAIPILHLDNRLRIPVMVEYNLNKAIDTIEDSMDLEIDEKIFLIKTFCYQLHGDGISCEVKKRMLEVTPEEEAFVFKNYESTINLYNTLSKEEKALARRWTTEMAGGMCDFLRRSIHTLKDLNEYCYYVAGTTGLYLTNLLKLKGSNMTEKVHKTLLENAVSFGCFLQKLNIIRDFIADRDQRKRCFWPRNYFEHERDNVKILNRMCYETLKNDLPYAIKYFIHIPPDNDSYDYFIRFLLSSGMEYLKILKNNNAVFSLKKVKLPKELIKNLYLNVSSQTREEFKDYCERYYEEEIASYFALR